MNFGSSILYDINLLHAYTIYVPMVQATNEGRLGKGHEKIKLQKRVGIRTHEVQRKNRLVDHTFTL